MTTLTLTDPVNGTVADANTIASNNAATKTVVNGNIDNANLASAAAIAATKLAAGANGQVLGMLAGVPTWLGGAGQIADKTVTPGPDANIDLQSLPATYAHMLIIAEGRGDTAATTIGARLRFNNDSGTNYGSQVVTALGSAAPAAGEEVTGTPTSAALGNFTASTAPASGSSPIIIFIPQYAGTTFFKSAFVLSGDRRGGGASGIGLFISTIQWASTAAISRVTVLPAGGNLIAGSRMTIYGIG